MKAQNQSYSDQCLIEDQNTIVIFVLTSQSMPKRTTVFQHATVSTLLSLLPPGKKTVFCGGSVVDQKRTFYELGIKSFSRVAIINGYNLPLKQEMFWKRTTKNDSELLEQLQLMDNLHLKRESSRIADLMMVRMENKRNSIQQKIRTNWMMRREESEEQQTDTITEYEKKINETALPILW
jgi:hypothetical protein